MTFLNVLVVKKSLRIGIVVSMMLHIVILAINGLIMNIYQNWRIKMKIIAWKIVGYDEDNNEVEIDIHKSHVANVVDDYITEEYEEYEDE